MVEEKRKGARHSLDRAAKFQPQDKTRPRDCQVIEISNAGVRLRAASGRVTNRFTLLLSSGRRECRVIWRAGNEVGAEFVEVRG
jgi:hypothetical protein